jgi:hypothetical protein
VKDVKTANNSLKIHEKVCSAAVKATESHGNKYKPSNSNPISTREAPRMNLEFCHEFRIFLAGRSWSFPLDLW